ncbi:MAG TPA: aminotransferase class V-fold PLP-dependent enzyme, partial [Desulfuromonadales bacterium]|nr:aminotransferase class V-fold PLP-dependent enzyme [Desulfuromonadales bacterium]
SHPKPEAVYRAVDHALRHLTSPGRGGHRLSLDASRELFEAREAVADFFGISDACRVAFTSGATAAINGALFGLLCSGDRVVTSTMEHNAVARPLRVLQDRGVRVVKVAADPLGFVDPERLKAACSQERTRMVILSHCSNVTGTRQPVEEIGPWCRREGILLLVDAAQSAGHFHIDVEKLGIDLLAAPGHKGLLGPQGTGFLYVREGVRIDPLVFGGTGTSSAEELPPEEMPERLESGTHNTPGIAGVRAGIEFLKEQGGQLRADEVALLDRLIEGLRPIDGLTLYGPLDAAVHCGVLSFNLSGRDPAEVGFLLDRDHGVMARSGLHCAPEAHRTIGTFPRGTVRLSPGCFTTFEEIDHAVAAVAAIASRPPA